MIHNLKIETRYWNRVKEGVKPWEIRLNDRDYQTGDIIVLREWNEAEKKYTEEYSQYEIKYLLHGSGYGLEEGYCIMTLEKNKK